MLRRIFVGPDLEDAIDILTKEKEKIKKAAGVLGITQSTGFTESEGPEYEGKIPAWLHPKVLGTVKEMIRSTVKDLKKEILETGGGEVNVPEFPEEPKESSKEKGKE